MRLLCIFATALALAGAPGFAQDNRLTVTGEGEAAAAPDIAIVTLGVTRRAEAAAAAMEDASGVAEAVLSRLDGMGIEARDIQTSDLSLNPVFATGTGPGEEGRIVGYEASNRVDLRVRDLGTLGEVLAAVLDDGANTLGGLRFSLADPEPVLDAARRDAVADARRKAELYAEAAGVTLGGIVTIDEVSGRGGIPMPMAEMRMSSVPVAAGETGYGAEVRVVFEILD